jgi:dTDP-glucose 4,6-dehydratase
MRFLVTGGAGFIGSNLVRLLVARGHSVLNVDKLTYAGNLSSLADLPVGAQHELLKLDICDGVGLQTALSRFRPDGIFHLAAESHVDRSIDGPGDFIHTNVLGTYTLLQAARSYFESVSPHDRSHFRFVHCSTDEVYGSLDVGGATEVTRYLPNSPYSASKAAADHLVRAWGQTYGLPVLVTNCSNVYGPWQFPEKLIPLVILKAIGNQAIPVYGDGKNVRDWIYVEDHVAALLTVLEKGVVGESYNIGAHNERRNIDLVQLLCRTLDQLQPRTDGKSYADLITLVGDRAGHDRRYSIDATKLHRDLGWRACQDFESGLRRTVQWYLDHRPWWQAILDGTYQLERLGKL